MISNAPEPPASEAPRPGQDDARVEHAPPTTQPDLERLTLRPNLPVIEAAHLVLTQRFEALARALEALQESLQGTRETHALRVATRRAAAALSVFHHHLDPDRTARAKRDLRSLRRAAGAVRTRDVEEELLLTAARGTPNAAGLAFQGDDAVVAAELMLARVHRKRTKALKRMRDGCDNCTPEKARRTADKLAASLHAARERVEGAPAPAFRHAPVAATAAHAAHAAVHDAAHHFDTASEHARNTADFDSLHRMRLAGKRLRYIIEIMSPCLDEDAAERALTLLRKLQDRLGEINDRHELALRSAKAAESLGPVPAAHTGGRTARAFNALRQSLLSERDALLRDFAAWWATKRPRLNLTLALLASDLTPVAPSRRNHTQAPPARSPHPSSNAHNNTPSPLLALELNEAIDNARGLLQPPQPEARA